MDISEIIKKQGGIKPSNQKSTSGVGFNTGSNVGYNIGSDVGYNIGNNVGYNTANNVDYNAPSNTGYTITKMDNVLAEEGLKKLLQTMQVRTTTPSFTERLVEKGAKFQEVIGGVGKDFPERVSGVAKKVGGLAKDILVEAPARAAGSLTLEAKKQKEFVPQTKFEEFLFGKEPVKAIGKRIEEAKITGEALGEKIAGETGGKIGKKLATPVVLGLTALDLTPFGGGKKTLEKTLLNTKTIEEASAVLSKAKVPQKLIEEFAPKFAKMTKIADVKNALKELEISLETIKKSSVIPKELEPLAEEARKYKGADEFGEAIFAKSGKKIEAFKTKNGKYDIKVISGEEIKPDITGTFEQRVINEQKIYRRENIPTDKLNENIKEIKNEVIRDLLPIDEIKLLKVEQYPEYQKLLNLYGKISRQEYTAEFNKLLERAEKELSQLNKPLAEFYNIAASIESSPIIETSKNLEQVVKGAKETKPEAKPISKGIKSLTEEIPKEVNPEKIKQIPKERGFVSTIKEELPQLKVGGQYIPRSTDELSIKARNLIKENIDLAESIALTQTDDRAVAIGSELLKHYNEVLAKTTDEVARNVLLEKSAQLAHTMASNLTELGQSIQAASIVGRLTPEGQLRFAAKEIERYNAQMLKLGKKTIPQLTPEQTEKILSEMKAIKEMPDGIEKSMKFKQLQDYISDILPSPLIAKITAVWKAGLLTGLKTSGLNLFSTLFNVGMETLSKITAKAVDNVASLFTGKQTIGLTPKGYVKGAKEGFEKGVRYLKTGFDERNIGIKYDWKRVNFGKSKVARALQKGEEAIFRLMGAEDQPFFYGVKANSLYNQAIAKANTLKLKGAEKQKFIQNLVENPTDEMLRYAKKDAEGAVFQNETLLGKAATGIQKIPGGEFVVPFGRTPSAVATQIINYTPVGIVNAIVSNIGKGKFDQRLFSQAIGRGITGTAIMYIGWKLAEKGLITRDRPTGEREQKLWELENKKPNSILIDNKYRGINVFGPAGNLLLVGAHFHDAFQESGSPSEAFSKAIVGSLKSFTEQTFLTGVNQIVNALNDPDRLAKSYASSFLSSFIPTIIGDIAKAIDPKERRTQSLLDRTIAKIPLLRETLEPQVTVLGEERPRVGSFLEVMIDPTRPSTQVVTPVIAELRRLYNNGYKVSPTLLGDKYGYNCLTPEQNTELWKRSGEVLNDKLSKLVLTEEYLKQDDEGRAKFIEGFVDRAKLIARAEMVLELTRDLKGEELKNKLSELKKGKLLTKDVFELYLKLL